METGWLDQLQALATVVAAVLIPLVVGIMGHLFTRAVKEREVQGKFVELAVEILREPPAEGTESIRRWATQVVDRYSGVPLPKEAREDLVARVGLTVRPMNLRNMEGKYTVPRQLREVRRVVVSDAQAPDLGTTRAALEQLQTAGSYHYLIDRDGTVYGIVDEAHVAHHTRGHNQDSIGIGLVHRTGGEPYPESQRLALVELLGQIARRHGIPVEQILPKSELDPRKRSDLPPLLPEIRAEVAARIRADAATGAPA